MRVFMVGLFVCLCCLVVLLFSGFVVCSIRLWLDYQPNNQTTRQPNNNQCLEDITEQSESNPGQSLGITTDEQGNCLEDSTYTV